VAPDADIERIIAVLQALLDGSPLPRHLGVPIISFDAVYHLLRLRLSKYRPKNSSLPAPSIDFFSSFVTRTERSPVGIVSLAGLKYYDSSFKILRQK
jgi:hypothetical protein